MPKIKLPKWFKDETIHLKDLSKEEKYQYDRFRQRTKYCNFIDEFLGSTEPTQRKTAKFVSIMVANSLDYCHVSNIDPRFRQSTGMFKTYDHQLWAKLLQNKHLYDFAKFKIMKKVLSDKCYFRGPYDTTKAFFHDDKYEDLLRKYFPKYGYMRALSTKDFTLLKEIYEISPGLIYENNIFFMAETFLNPGELLDVLMFYPRKGARWLEYVYSQATKKGIELDREKVNKLIVYKPHLLKKISIDLDDEFVDRIIEQSGKSLLYIPKKFWTPERVRKAVLKAPSILRRIPPEYHNSRLLLETSLKHDHAKKYYKRKNNASNAS